MLISKQGLLITGLISTLLLSGCGRTDSAECFYDMDASESVRSIRVFYPCELPDNSVSYNATTLSGGFTNTQENMYWLAQTLVEEGDMVVFALSAQSNSSTASYTDAHLDAFDRMVGENSNSGSPLYLRLDKVGLMGFSMGGGGVLNASDNLGSDVDTVVSIAPYSPNTDLSNSTADTLLIVGENDSIAPANFAEGAYANLPDTLNKALLELDNFTHLRWMNNYDDDNFTQVAKQMILSFLDYSMNGNPNGADDIINAPAEIVLNQNTL